MANQASATFTFACNESNCTFTCKLHGGVWEACTSPKAYSGLADGAHTFEIAAKDGAGNADLSPVIRNWTVDTTPPDTTIVSGPNALTNSTNATFTFTANETVSYFECRLDGGDWQTCASAYALTGLSTGNPTFEVAATDIIGNNELSTAAWSWTVDLTPPDTIMRGPSALTTNTDATLTFSSPDTDATAFLCRLDGGVWQTCVSPQVYSGLADDSHTFEVAAQDAAGNQDANPVAWGWRVGQWQISALQNFACGVSYATGKLYSWGENLYGQLGDGRTIDKNVPTQVGIYSDWATVAVGGHRTCVAYGPAPCIVGVIMPMVSLATVQP